MIAKFFLENIVKVFSSQYTCYIFNNKIEAFPRSCWLNSSKVVCGVRYLDRFSAYVEYNASGRSKAFTNFHIMNFIILFGWHDSAQTFLPSTMNNRSLSQ